MSPLLACLLDVDGSTEFTDKGLFRTNGRPGRRDYDMQYQGRHATLNSLMQRPGETLPLDGRLDILTKTSAGHHSSTSILH